jgi:hypothetical protein
MSSPKFSELVAPDAIELMVGAVTDVAERSFFAVAERTPAAGLQGASDPWLVASVRFEEAACAGVVSCAVPADLARSLFDAFNGRDPFDPPPPHDELADLVGEFSNMVCGTWLTRLHNRATFDLSRPMVEAAPRRPAVGSSRGAAIAMTLNDQPLLIDIRAAA